MPVDPKETPLEFDCIACGVHVINVGLTPPNFAGRCLLCQFLEDEIHDPAERELIRATLRGQPPSVKLQ